MIQNLKLTTGVALLLFMVVSGTTYGQRNMKDSTVFSYVIAPTYGAFWPEGDLKERYGFHNQIGLLVNFKDKKNWIWGAEAYYLFGKQMKQMNVFEQLLTDKGYIRNSSGRYADILAVERGWHANASFGRVFPWFGPNPNSGVMLKVGVGWWMHKTYIESRYDNVPQLQGDYVKGYDRLTHGFATTQFLGYLFQANRRFFSFYLGFEVTEGFLQGIRDYNFDTQMPDDKNRLDIMYGVKIGWLVPIGQRSNNEFHIR